MPALPRCIGILAHVTPVHNMSGATKQVGGGGDCKTPAIAALLIHEGCKVLHSHWRASQTTEKQDVSSSDVCASLKILVCLLRLQHKLLYIAAICCCLPGKARQFQSAHAVVNNIAGNAHL